MDAKLSPGTAVLILLGVASAFASNHLCARIAFDHGASVAAAVSVRATFTALLLLAVMRWQNIAIVIPRELRWKALVAGLLVASQSYCLYSAVALIPPALALLVFQTSPMLYVLLTWALGKERARWSALAPMLLALAGLALALNLRPAHLDADWAAVRTGAGWAFASALSMTVVYYLNANALKALDGRLRTFAMTAVTAVLVISAGALAGAHALPNDGAGWAGLALLHVALVGDLVGVDRRRLAHHHQPPRVRRAAAFAGQYLQRRTQPVAYIGALLGCGAQKHERPDLVAVVAGDDCVLDQRIGRGDELHAHGTHVDPGAGGELEVLGDAAVEDDALHRLLGIGELHRVADAVEPFLVERRAGQVVALVVARHHVRSAHAHLELAAARHELDLARRHRQPDYPGPLHVEMHRRRKRRGFGRSPRGEHHHVGLERLDAVPKVLRQRSRGVEDRVQLAEEGAAQRLVFLEVRQDQVEAARHVEVHRRRDLGEVLHRRLDQARHGLAGVDVHRAAVAQDQVEVVAAAEGVVPRQPVDRHRRPVLDEGPGLRELLLVRAQHAMRVDHALRQAGRAGSEEDLGDRPGPYLGVLALLRRARIHLQQVRNRDGLRAHRIERRLEFHRIGGVDQAWIEQLEDVLQLAEVFRHQRIRRRDGRHRNADVHRAEREQRVVHAVVGKDRHRPLRAEVLVTQRA